MLNSKNFFEIDDEITMKIFADCNFVWEALLKISIILDDLVQGKQTVLGELMPGAHIAPLPIYIGRGAIIEPGAYVQGPAYIGDNVIIRHGAYVRENVIMLPGSILGHASEAKNSIFLPNAAAPHFNYVGDSILGKNVNLGAGTKLSNLTIISKKNTATGKRPTVKIHVNDIEFDTGLVKMGAIIGDNSQTGCNCVLNPGCLIGPNTLVYANMSLRKGYHPGNSIIKLRQQTSRITRG